jgi:hypothetical protein
VDEKEILALLYQEECSFARHHEELRASVANIIIAVSAGGMGLVAFDQKLAVDDIPLTLFIAILGVFGAVFGSKHYERVRLHLNRARQYTKRLEELAPDMRIASLREAGDEANKKRFPRLFPLRLNSFWVALHLLIALLGVSLTVLIFIKHGS